ncbi:hypothetical protein BDV40DRAFT_283833 [Aspergillus tamarii]|uniref:Uncharacterized protein n=1 Tax=Aspergillus tamarii TaxID=41984 RepID=A0A5N6U9U9_ASPTM|nr:hypothetical protein BDV40DRAFT_283833 [Aspergillus tamarii]
MVLEMLIKSFENIIGESTRQRAISMQLQQSWTRYQSLRHLKKAPGLITIPTGPMNTDRSLKKCLISTVMTILILMCSRQSQARSQA